jgi:hypothetical protein
MLTRTRLATAVVGLGAVISGTWAYVNIHALVEMYEAGGGGGFVTSGAIDVLEYLLPAAIAFVLAMRVRERTGRVQFLRRAHQIASFTMAALVVLLGAAAIAGAFNRGIDGVWFGVLIGAFIAGAIWQPVQIFFVAVFAGLLINQGAPAR